VAISLAALLPLLPDGGIGEFWDRTLGYNQERHGWNSLWARFPDLDWLQSVAQACVVGLAVVLAFVPRRRSPEQVATLGAGLMAALQLTMPYWSSTYIIWFAPLAFAGLFAAYECSMPERATAGPGEMHGRGGRTRRAGVVQT
jgi:hypothetical protein